MACLTCASTYVLNYFLVSLAKLHTNIMSNSVSIVHPFVYEDYLKFIQARNKILLKRVIPLSDLDSDRNVY